MNGEDITACQTAQRKISSIHHQGVIINHYKYAEIKVRIEACDKFHDCEKPVAREFQPRPGCVLGGIDVTGPAWGK
jgi:hypothetical protein